MNMTVGHFTWLCTFMEQKGRGPKNEYDDGTLHLALYIYGASANEAISLVGEIFREDNGMLLQFLVGDRLVLLRSFH